MDIPTRTIDQIVIDERLPHVDFIKVDAEGAELKVLKGAGVSNIFAVTLAMAKGE